MKIAIASGKGGTGKTTVATNLAWLASQNGLATAYLDCDTEAPNSHLFLRPVIEERREVVRMIPQVDGTRCTLCGQCGEICQFSAIVCLGQKILTFPELCHSFGVVINRALSGVRETRQFCQQARIPILAEIPDVMAIAEAYSEGKLAVEAVPGMRRTFAKLLLELTTIVQTEALPETVRLNLNQIVHPPAEPASRHRQPADGQPAPVCYLALRARGPKSNRV